MVFSVIIVVHQEGSGRQHDNADGYVCRPHGHVAGILSGHVTSMYLHAVGLYPMVPMGRASSLPAISGPKTVLYSNASIYLLGHHQVPPYMREPCEMTGSGFFKCPSSCTKTQQAVS